MSIVIQETRQLRDAKDRYQVGQTLGSPELRFLSFAARFKDLVEDFDFPSQGIPFELLNSVRGSQRADL